MTLITTMHGSAAFGALGEAVAESKGNDPLREVMLVVPTEAIGTAARRWLAAHGRAGAPGIAGLTIVTLYRLAERIAAQELAGGGRRPVTSPVLAGAMRAVVAAVPGSFQPIADHPQTARTLAEASGELNRLDAALLPELGAVRRVTGDVVELHTAVRASLAAEYYDEVELLRRATDLVAELPPAVLFLPKEFTPAEQRLIDAVRAKTRVSAIVGVTGSPGDERVLRSVGDEIGRASCRGRV